MATPVKLNKETFCGWVTEAIDLGCNWYRTSPVKEGDDATQTKFTTTVVDYVNSKMKELGYDGYIVVEKLKAYVAAYPELQKIYNESTAAKVKAVAGKPVDLELI